MGVVIGQLNTGSVPCVEKDDSPEVTISNPTLHALTRATVAKRWGNYANISAVRDISVKRKFIMLKENIPAVSAWLASLQGGPTEYNTGDGSTQALSGEFALDKEFKFASISPRMAECQVTFVGQVLDCNYSLPLGLKYTKISDRVYRVTLDDVTVKEYESATDGDGSGIEVRSGPILRWDELPLDIRDTVPMTHETLPTDDEVLELPSGPVRQPTYYPTHWRLLYLCVNGEVAKTWHIPTMPYGAQHGLIWQPVYYGITEAEWEANGNDFPLITSGQLDFRFPNDRLAGLGKVNNTWTEALYKWVLKQEGIDTWRYEYDSKSLQYLIVLDEVPAEYARRKFILPVTYKTPPALPSPMWHYSYFSDRLTDTNTWRADKNNMWTVAWPSPIPYQSYDIATGGEVTLYFDPGANPYPYKYYGRIGYCWFLSPWATEYNNDWRHFIIDIWWTRTGDRCVLKAKGRDGVEYTLLDWEKTVT